MIACTSDSDRFARAGWHYTFVSMKQKVLALLFGRAAKPCLLFLACLPLLVCAPLLHLP